MGNEKKQRNLSFVFEVSDKNDDLARRTEEQIFTTFFVSRKKTEMRSLSVEELETEICDCDYAKMIMIMTKGDSANKIRELLNKISKERGVCSPIIEKDRAIMYFPKLRYSDMGLLEYICEHKANLDNCSLRMTGSKLIGEIYV